MMLKHGDKTLSGPDDGKRRSHTSICRVLPVYRIIVFLIPFIILLPLNGENGMRLWLVESATSVTSAIVIPAPLPPVIRIGAVYGEYQRAGSMESAFKYAIYRINKDKTLFTDTQFIYDIEYIRRDDTFRSTKRICRQFENSVPIIIGPSDAILARHIESMCSSLQLPYIGMFVDDEIHRKHSPFAFSFYPTQQQLNRAYKDLLLELNWSNVAVIYEDTDSVFKQPQDDDEYNIKWKFYVRQVNLNTYRTVLRAIRQKEIYNIIVDISASKIQTFLRILLQLQMNDHRYHYLFTTFDLESVDLEDFKYNNVNMTSFRMVDIDSQRYNEITAPMRKLPHTGLDVVRGHSYLMTESAVAFDAVYTFANGLKRFAEKYSLNLHNVSCDLENSWSNGRLLYEAMNGLDLEGLTGPLHFKRGQRSQLKFDVLQMKAQQLRKMGTWTLKGGINLTAHQQHQLQQQKLPEFRNPRSPNITLLVITKEEEPYVIIDRSVNLTGKARFKGYCIDLLDAIAKRVGFNYRLQIVADNLYGIYNPETQRWNGIVHELMEKRADLSVAPMTITPARSKVVDFTEPFANVGISILYKMPGNRPTRLLLFMHPLAMETWFYVFAAYILVSLSLFVMARFSPYEWHRPSHPPCFNFNDIVENQFSLSNSFWFVTGTFLLRRSGLNPQATSTRIVGVIWWFFTLIIISSYTANLAAFLTVERISDLPIDSVIDLVEQTDIAYGALNGGSTMAFFRESKIALYQKIWHYMEQRHRSVLVQSFEEGVRRVENGNYALLAETPLLEYAIRNNCNFTQVGGLLSNTRAYAIATPKGSPWLEPISEAIRALQANGFLQRLHEKWLLSKSNVKNISSEGIKELKNTSNNTTTLPVMTTMKSIANTTYNNFIMQRSSPSSSKNRNAGICNQQFSNVGDHKLQDNRPSFSSSHNVNNEERNEWKQPVNALHLENVAGVFMVLLCGLATAAVVAVIEFLYNSRIQGHQTDNQLLCSEMPEELRHAIHCPILHLSRQPRDSKCVCYKCIQQQHPTTVNTSNTGSVVAVPVASAAAPATTTTITPNSGGGGGGGLLSTTGTGVTMNSLTATLPTSLKRVQYNYLN